MLHRGNELDDEICLVQKYRTNEADPRNELLLARATAESKWTGTCLRQ